MNQARLLELILSPHISEKATLAAEKNNEYVFHVVKNASKPEVKDAIEFIFNAKVKTVRIMNTRPKKKMFKGQEGTRKAWKKAYVTLHADQKLELVGSAAQ
jgi:large subunit ribosomal protein L23